MSRRTWDAAGLRRRPANFAPLTPISFLDRAAHVFPDRMALVYGDHKETWREHALFCRAVRIGAPRWWRRSRRCRSAPHGEHPADARRALRGADGRRGTEHDQHTARPRDGRLYPRALRGADPDRRRRISRYGPRSHQRSRRAAARDRLHRPDGRFLASGGRGGFRRLRRYRRRCGTRRPSRRRVDADRGELYLRYDGAAQGRRVFAPGRVLVGGLDDR